MKILHIYILQIVLLVIRYGRLQFDYYIILNNTPCLASEHYAEKKEKIIDLRKNTNFEALRQNGFLWHIVLQ